MANHDNLPPTLADLMRLFDAHFGALQRAQDEQTRLNTETIEKAFQAQEEAGE